MAEFSTRWSMDPIRNSEAIRLESISLGIEGSLVEAGSFTGFLKRSPPDNEVFGLTAAHCVPPALVGMPICSPSTLEVTARLKFLLPYTSLSKPEDCVAVTVGLEAEAKSLVRTFRFLPCLSGVTFSDPFDQFQEKTGVLYGGRLGTIVARELSSQNKLLFNYARGLWRLGLPTFYTKRSWHTTVDWCIFSCAQNRYGRNIYSEYPITETGYLYPHARVEKIGRSSGFHGGYVNRILLQHWGKGGLTHEIAILGDDDIPFGINGDSGGCVLVDMRGIFKAAGILIAKNRCNDLALATPLHLVLDSARSYQWA
ncbi:unnamed protein product [Tuber aestivum]|uniref:Peptidase S1 domain-containing protein n=1 Tax=Tuber aestivum TaxID=59557 RepID=A0A292PZF7_9PEZI|nr:unnamed protein product [Tuber aestivum]